MAKDPRFPTPRDETDEIIIEAARQCLDRGEPFFKDPPAEPQYCTVHSVPMTHSEECPVCYATQFFVVSRSATSGRKFHYDWQSFSDWLGDEISDGTAADEWMERLKKEPGPVIIQWRVETGIELERITLAAMSQAVIALMVSPKEDSTT